MFDSLITKNAATSGLSLQCPYNIKQAADEHNKNRQRPSSLGVKTLSMVMFLDNALYSCSVSLHPGLLMRNGKLLAYAEGGKGLVTSC